MRGSWDFVKTRCQIWGSVAQRPGFESALRVLKGCCRPFLMYIYDKQCDFMQKNHKKHLRKQKHRRKRRRRGTYSDLVKQLTIPDKLRNVNHGIEGWERATWTAFAILAMFYHSLATLEFGGLWAISWNLVLKAIHHSNILPRDFTRIRAMAWKRSWLIGEWRPGLSSLLLCAC